MLCFRPTKKQWFALRRFASPVKVFDAAYRRWKAGELNIGSPAEFTKEKMKGAIGSPFVLSRDYDIPDSETARAILEAHIFKTPISHEKEIAKLDREISAFMKSNKDVIAINAMTGEPIQ